jgi:hypothetical protein
VVVVVVDVVVDVVVEVVVSRRAAASTLSAGDESPPLKSTAENDAPAMATTRPPPTSALRSWIERISHSRRLPCSRDWNRRVGVAA